MNFTNINNLSMTGGDDFTDINQIIERCVLLDVNQTIVSSKTFDNTTTTTFDGTLVSNNAVTFNNAVAIASTTSNSGTFTNQLAGTISNLGTLNIGGTLNVTTNIVGSKPTLTFSNTGDTAITATNNINLTATSINLLSNTALSATTTNTGYLINTGTFDNDASGNIINAGTFDNIGTFENTTRILDLGGTINLTADITGDKPLLVINNTGDTAINSTGYLELQAGVGNSVIVLAPDGLRVLTSVFVSDVLTINGTNFEVNPSASHTLKVSSVTKELITSSVTTLTNPTIQLNDGTTTRFTQPNGTTTLTNTNIATNAILTQTGNFTAKGTTILLQDSIPTTHYNQTSTTSTLTNSAINLQDETSVTRFAQSSLSTTLRNATINLQDNTPTIRFQQTNGQTTLTNTNIGITGILTTTGACTINGAFTTTSSAVTLKDNASTTHFLQSSSATTLTNTTINLQDATPTTRFSQTNGLTTLTNPIITNVCSTRFAVQAVGGTDILSMTPASLKTNPSGNNQLRVNSTTKALLNATETTLTNQAIIFVDNLAVERFRQSSSVTTITNTNIATNGILTQTGGSTLTSGTANNLITTTTGSNTLSATSALGTNAISSTTGATAITTTTGKASISSTTGVIELKTGATGDAGINIENTHPTAGGITIKTSPTSGNDSFIFVDGASGVTIRTTSISSAFGRILLQSTSNSHEKAIFLEAVNGGITIESTGSDDNININTTQATSDIKLSAGRHLYLEADVTSSLLSGQIRLGNSTTYAQYCNLNFGAVWDLPSSQAVSLSVARYADFVPYKVSSALTAQNMVSPVSFIPYYVSLTLDTGPITFSAGTTFSAFITIYNETTASVVATSNSTNIATGTQYVTGLTLTLTAGASVSAGDRFSIQIQTGTTASQSFTASNKTGFIQILCQQII